MQCQYCGNEVSSADGRFTCPACEFPLQQNASSTARREAPTLSSTPSRSMRLGTISLSKVPEVHATRMLVAVFALDVSSSMEGEKAREAFAGLKSLVQSLLPLGGQCRFGITEFNDSARITQQLTCPAEAEGLLKVSEPDGMTNIADGLRTAGSLLSCDSHMDASRVIVLLSDGADTSGSSPIREANHLKASGILILTIAYGKHADETTLRAIASSDDMFYTKPANGSELKDFLSKVGKTLTVSVQMGQQLHRSLSRIS